jgi:S-adenosylmethionine hydrolase
MTIITLTSDFGVQDGFTGVMKGVIWGIAPQAQIADLSHAIGPQDIPAAALILERSTPYFPAGTIHVVVVDPGVGTRRRPLLAQIGAQYYVGPDNGTLTVWLARAAAQRQPTQFIHLNRPQYWLAQVSNVFHGRDIFAPAAAHLAAGVPMEQLGDPIDDPVRLTLPQPERTASGWRGTIIHIDHFGNLAADVRQEHLAEATVHTVKVGGAVIEGLARTFGERPPGTLAALIGSSGNLEIALVNGSAAQTLNAQVGDPIEVITG